MSVRDDLLVRVDIVDVVGRYVQMRRTGKNRLGLCPFHKEKTPSFTVAEDKQIYKCFGCGKGGNAVNFVMEIERIDFRDAMKELARMINFDLTPYERNPEVTEKRQQEREKLKLLNKRVQEFFVQHLDGSPAASYVRDARKLTETTITTFGIGYAPDSYTLLIDYLAAKGFTHEDMIQAGVVSQGNGGPMPFFRNRLTFPIFDHIGNTVGFGGRSLLPDQQPKYLNTTETPLYEKSQILFGLDKARHHIREHGFLVIVEGYMDVIALAQYGIPVGVATCGTALTSEHIKLLRRHTDHVVFLFDNDPAGEEATIRALKIAYQAELYPRVFRLPSDKKDVDERLTDQGAQVPPAQIQEGSIDAFDAVVERLATTIDITNPVLRKKFQQTVFEIMQYIQDYGILMLFIEKLGAYVHLSGPVMMKEFKTRLKQQKRGGGSSTRYEQPSQRVGPPALDELMITLREDDFWKTLCDHEHIGSMLESMSRLGTVIPGILPDLSNDRERLSGHQLWRERECETLGFDKKYQLIHTMLQKYLHDLLRTILKRTDIAPEQKQSLMQIKIP